MSLMDVSAAAAIARAKRFATSFEATPGPAGVLKTRREPPLLADRHQRMINGFYRHLPAHQRADFHRNVLARLSGHPADFAVRAAIVAAAMEQHGFTVHQLRAVGFDLREHKHVGGGSKELAKEAIA